MKNFKNIILAGLVLAAALFVTSPLPVEAADELSYWAGGGTDVSTTLCYSVVSRMGKNAGTPRLTFVNATSDKAASVVQFYTVGQPVVANYTNSTTTLFVNITNTQSAFTTNAGIIVICHVATDTYERRVLAAGSASTNLFVTSAPTSAVLPGDLIWPATATGTIPVGNATLSLNGPGIYAGQRGKPLLMEVDGTSACQLNAAAADYDP